MEKQKNKKTIKKEIKRSASFFSRHKIITAVGIIALIFILTGAGAKLLLYIDFFLGKDILVTLEADKDHFSLAHGQQGEVGFDARVRTNPFCSAKCSYSFIDISSNSTVDKKNFDMSPADPFKKKFTIKSPDTGKGIWLYRFDMSCKSKKSFFCHTAENPVKRSILITVNYTLSPEERRLKADLKKTLTGLANRTEKLKAMQSYFEEAAYLLEEENISAGDKLAKINSTLRDLQNIWDQQKYHSLSERVS